MTQLRHLGRTETRQYSPMGELTQIQTASLTLGYAYHPNGRLLSESINSSETITYQYDDWNRLSTASSSTGTWGNRYVYDGVNNLTNKIVTAGSAPSLSVSINSATNRITGQSYDANGNVTVHPETAQSIAYDFENRVTNSNAQYDRQNRILTTDGVKYTFYGLSGEKLAIFNGTTRTRRYLYFAGRLIGTANQSEVKTPQTLDRLGSIRQSTTTQTMRFFPYGEPRDTATTTVQQYATYETESSATSTYDAWNRSYSAQQGRFLSPDPYQASGGPADPGSWNRYSYVGNNPVNWADPVGLDRVSLESLLNGQIVCIVIQNREGETFYSCKGFMPQIVSENSKPSTLTKADISLDTPLWWEKVRSSNELYQKRLAKKLSSLSLNCQGAIGAALATKGKVIDDLRAGAFFWNVAIPEVSSLKAGNLVSGARRADLSIGVWGFVRSGFQPIASVIDRTDGSISNDVILYSGFNRLEVNEQDNILLHESLHTVGFNELQLADALGVTWSSGELPGVKISEFLNKNCPK